MKKLRKNLTKNLDFNLLNEYNKRKFITKEHNKMKEFIEKSGLSTAEFAKKYEIPYNTVRQWAEGLRSAPEWLAKLFKNNTQGKEWYYLKTVHENGVIEELFDKKNEIEEVKNYNKKKYKTVIFREKTLKEV